MKSRVYPRLITINGKQVRIDEKQVIFWSADYDRRAKRERQEALAKTQKIIDNPSVYGSYGSSKYIKNENGKKLTLNDKKIENDERFDGFYAIVTSELDKTSEEIIEIYRGLWKIEESFKILKSDFSARPVYLSTENHIKAHFMICFLSLVILRLLEQQLGGKYSSKQICESISKSTCHLVEENIYLLSNCNEIVQTLCPELGKKYHKLKEIKKILANTKI